MAVCRTRPCKAPVAVADNGFEEGMLGRRMSSVVEGMPEHSDLIYNQSVVEKGGIHDWGVQVYPSL